MHLDEVNDPDGSQRVARFVFKIFFVIGALALLLGVWSLVSTHQKRGSWPHATGTAVDLRYREGTRDQKRGNTTRRITTHNWCPIWEFTPEGKDEPVRTKSEAGGCIQTSSKERATAAHLLGITQKLQYDPANPSDVIVADRGAYSFGAGFTIAGLVFVGFAIAHRVRERRGIE